MEDLSYEQQAHDAGYALVCGVDEAGAGPLMGPVYRRYSPGEVRASRPE